MAGTKDIEVVVTITVPDTVTEADEQSIITNLQAAARHRCGAEVVDAGVQHMKALKTQGLLFLWNEVQLAGEAMRGIDTGEVFCCMTCNEAQWLADIFAAAGDQETHDHIISEHARGDDDPEDTHHDLYVKHEEET